MAVLEVLTHFKRVGWTITTESSKMPLGKFSAWTSFQIILESNSFFLVVKCDCCLDTPRLEFGCVWHFSSIMFGKTGLQILRWTHIMMRFCCNVCQNINVMKVFHKFALLLIHDAVVRLRQGFRLRKTTPWQAGVTDFLRLLRIRFTLVNPPAVRGMACPDVKKAVRFSAISNPVRFSPPSPRLPPS